jgi:hypothetical protein
MRVTLRPTVPDDLPYCIGEPLPHRIRAITAVIPADPSRTALDDGSVAGDTVLGLGGVGYRPDGTVIVFAQIADEGRKYPFAIHRAGLAVMKMIRESGLKLVVAEAQAGNPAAGPWLLRLGFRPAEIGGRKAFVWERGVDAIDR